MSWRIIIAGATLAVLLSLVVHVALHSPISPLPLALPSSSFQPNNLLKSVEKIGEGILILPEDTCLGKDGKLYTATRDGWIKRMHSNGTWENWKMIGGSSLLGITPSVDGDIIVCDADQGLLKVGEGGLTVLATEVDGTKILFADDAIEASDGSIYFSDASSKFEFHDFFLDLLEARSTGRLLKYDSLKKRTSVVLSNLSFPNGVALSPNEDYLLLSETYKFRCLKYWLKGELKGSTEVFIDNLPGAPDNINLAPDGSYWIALIQIRSWWLDLIHSSPLAKLVIAAFPWAVERLPSMLFKSAVVVNVDSNGKIRRMFDDYNGETISFVTSALENEGHLYLGNLGSNFLGKFTLKD
ncbi:protein STRICTOSIDINE SYNTHASE-LIKE 4-like [Phalaenopsis equestris]|uniref:protein STRICTOSIDINE SYNTHASE-LIKE 4-like n=1 Tax=Phalaenopsis equestris TaxID=78828 RepID=UPI0009E52895|nr:protein STRICTOSIDINE SYNTHASE-LIKE 4-like [Phalaenopsis equestris]